MTQRDEVLSYMEANGSIDPLTALNELGVMRLAAVVCDLKKAGFPIEAKTVYRTNARGQRKHWAEYSLK